MVPKWAKIACNMTFWALFENFHSKKIEMNSFSGSTIFGVLLENMSSETFFVVRVRVS